VFVLDSVELVHAGTFGVSQITGTCQIAGHTQANYLPLSVRGFRSHREDGMKERGRDVVRDLQGSLEVKGVEDFLADEELSCFPELRRSLA